jgi:dihydroorotate dehydrogenase
MKETSTRIRNRIARGVYSRVLKPIFFSQDPEDVHDRMTRVGVVLGSNGIGKGLIRVMFDYKNLALEQIIHGIKFGNPIGLSAGFDKNAELTDIIPHVGFGFAEAGSITGNPCAGNAKPRLWRLPKSKSLAVYYGLKNEGCEAIAARLKDKHFNIPIGMSVAMTNCKENLELQASIDDICKAFRCMEPLASYMTVNISCPNAEGGQPFMDPYKLWHLFDALDKIPTTKPVFVKLSPDLSRENLDQILDILRTRRVQGIICTNLTKKRDGNSKIASADKLPEKGGLSGKVVQESADDLLVYICRKEGKRFTLIGSGGVFTAEDAYRKIRLGASLVQLITGMIFEGPQVISEINQGLVQLLARDGFKNISEAVGIDAARADA